MRPSTLEQELTKAEERVANGCDRIAYQRAVISRHEHEGLDSAIARAILEQLETLQRTYIADRDRLLAEAGKNSGESIPGRGQKSFPRTYVRLTDRRPSSDSPRVTGSARGSA
jgi:hypothetical protein